MKRILASMLLAGGLFAGTAVAADFAGTWNLTITTPMGERNAVLVVNKDGTGTYDGAATQVKIDGDSISFPVTRSTQRGDMTMTYAGKLADGKITGTMVVAGMGPGGPGGAPGGPPGGAPGGAPGPRPGAGAPGGGMGPGGGAGAGPGAGMAPPAWTATRAQ